MNKIDIVQKFKIHIDEFISESKGNSIHIEDIYKDIKYLISVLLSLCNDKNNTNDKILQTIENENIKLVLLDNIHDLISKISGHSADKDIKGIMHEFAKIKKIFADDYDSIFKTAVQTIENSIKDIKDIKTFSLNIRKYIFLWPLYEVITQNLLKSDELKEELKEDILIINEENKSFILSNTFSNVSKKSKVKTDIGIKTYGLIPVTNLLSIDEVSNLVIKKSNLTKKEMTFTEFTKLCKDKKINLVLIKKQVNNGVNYNILDLLDYAKSDEYAKTNNSKDGITIDTIKRYDTIKYIGKRNASNIISYKITPSDKEELLILEEIWPNKYYIMSNKLSDYILKKSELKEFIDFIESQTISKNRINDYNSIINKKIMKNMFLDKKYDIDEINEKSVAKDPKYFRHEIQSNIIDAYTKLTKGVNIKNIQDFSKIVLDENLIEAFSTSINKFSVIDNDIIDKTDIFLSYIFNINIYERDFKKMINDVFKFNIQSIIKDKVFAETNQEIIKRKLYNIFTSILDSVLNSVIHIDNNMYQVFMFKNELLKIAKDNSTSYNS